MGKIACLGDDFWAHTKLEESGCITWQRARLSGQGYGRVTVRGRGMLRAHVYAYELAHGRPVPEGLLVLHSCDNPPCVNPAHLYAGTWKQNAQDREARRRRPPRRGADHPFSKLTPEQASEIRASHEKGLTLAVKYGVHPTTICEIRKGRKWRWLLPAEGASA